MKELQQLIKLLILKGWGYTYNRVHFILFWNWIRNHPPLIFLVNLRSRIPTAIEVEVTTRCGLRCIMCEHTYWSEPPRDMSFEEFKSIINQFPRLKWIGLTGIGESFINPGFIKMLEYVKSKNIYVELYDNLFFLDESQISQIIGLEIDKLLISFDAATKETYERIRPGASFEKVVSNIFELFNLKKEKRSDFPKIIFHFIIMKDNLHEVFDYIQLVSELANEPTEIRFSRMLHNYSQVLNLFTEIDDQLIKSCERLAKHKGILISWNLDVPSDKPPVTECIEWTMPFIFANGDVIPCCSANESNKRDFQKQNSMGNIFQEPFVDIWNGTRYKQLRQHIRSGEFPPSCKDCCLYSKK